MRIFLESLGCRLNHAEMAGLGRQLAAAGHELAGSAAEADLCVLNSCAVTGEAARQSRQLARQLARANPSARLIVTGCYATLEGETVARLPNVELVVGNARKDEMFGLIQRSEVRGQESEGRGQGAEVNAGADAAAGENDTLRPSASSAVGFGSEVKGDVADVHAARDAAANEKGYLRPSASSAVNFWAGGEEGGESAGEIARPANDAACGTPHAPRTRAFVKAQDGCRNRCTFCIVTVARGAERSRSVAAVVAEVNALHAEGYQEAVLTGVHLGGYGSDTGESLRALVGALLAETSIPRLRLSSLEPFDLAPDFFDLWPQSDGRLMPHLHLPAQSGSDAVLRRMARRNRAADFEALAGAARTRIPGLTLTTDLIAGFPGETESDFAETMAFARRMGFAHIHVFPYSARQGTAAARFGAQVPEPERRRRVAALNALDGASGRAVRAAFVGGTRPVLWETRDRSPSAPPALAGPGDGGSGRAPVVWSGLTDNYLRVRSAVPAGIDLHNRIAPVRLARLEEDVLWGELTNPMNRSN